MNWTYNPEKIDYQVSLVDEPITSETEEEEEENQFNNTLIIGDHIFYNVPFTINRNNRSIATLNINTKDLLGDSGIDPSDTNRYIKETITCNYYAMQKSVLDTVLGNKFSTFDVSIDNKSTIDFVETPNLAAMDTAFKTHSVNGEYKIEKISYKKTADSNLYDVTIVFIGTKVYPDYGTPESEEEGEEGVNGIDFEKIIDQLNILDNPNISVSLVTPYISFDGFLSDFSSSSMVAMGKEVKLTEYLITEAFRKQWVEIWNEATQQYDDFEIENIVDWITYLMYYYRNYMPFSGGVTGDYVSSGSYFNLLGKNNLFYVDNNVWEILISVANALELFMSARENGIYFTTGSFKPDYYNADYTVTEILNSQIESKTISIKAQKYYDSVKLVGQFTVEDTNNPRAINIEAKNKQVNSSRAINYTTMEEQDTEEDTTTPSFDFEFTHNAPSGMNCSISYQQLTFIEDTVPEDIDIGSYVGSITISVRPDAAQTGIDVELMSAKDINGADIETDVFIVPSLSDYTHIEGLGYIHIFTLEEDINFINLVAYVNSFFNDTLLENYYVYNEEGKYTYSHSSNLIQLADKTALDMFCQHLLEIKNSKMKQISLSLNIALDLYPGDVISILSSNNEFRYYTIENISVKFNDNKYTTEITCYE